MLPWEEFYVMIRNITSLQEVIAQNRVAWYEGNSGYETKPAGLKFPNQLGLYDMSGNVFEWCWDWYQAGFFDNASEKNPVHYKIGEGRVLRGGSALGSKETCRIIQRNNDAPDGKWRNAGFRLIFSFNLNFNL
jgi:formylglycine-generating enzyme required for sulfatase activity